jgi:hypothetical protein
MTDDNPDDTAGHESINQQLRRAAGKPRGDEPKEADKPPTGFDGGAREDPPSSTSDADKINEQIRNHIGTRRGTAAW